MNEKLTHHGDIEAVTEASDVCTEIDPQLASRARRRVDRSVLPPLVLGLFFFQLDRMNLASALTGGFAKDVQISQQDVNLGNLLMFGGIVLLEVPSNMAMQAIGPRKWLSAQIFMFGLTASLQCLIRNRAGFLACRVALGLAESGYIPGASYTLASWYRRQDLARRIAILFFGMFGGNAASPMLASGILKLEGRGGLKGWQWLFLLEGLFTIVVALALPFWLPGSPESPKPLLGPGITTFPPAELDALRQSLEHDGQKYVHSVRGQRIPLRVVRKTVLQWRRWPHFISTFAVFSTWSPLTTYTPSIIVALGFDRTSANALAAVGAVLSIVVVFLFAAASDRSNRRGACVISAQLCYLVTLIVINRVQPSVGRWSKYGLWTAVNAFAVGYHPIHNSWVQMNCHEAGERNISVAMWVMSAISGLMAGTQYFQGDDRPLYSQGTRTLIIMVSIGIFFAGLQMLVYWIHNRSRQGSSVEFVI